MVPSCSHPLFKWSAQVPWHAAPPGLSRPCIFYFERPTWITPTANQIKRYRRAKRIVEKLGGRMILHEWEIVGENPELSHDDVREILTAVQRDYPDCRIVDHWNGEGCYSMSVGVDFGDAVGQADTQIRPEMSLA